MRFSNTFSGAPPPPNTGSRGFTLAEVLITLGIIGIVAALTFPGLVNKYQKTVFKNQYKKAYTVLYNALKLTQAKWEGPVQCFYWDVKPEYICTQECIGRNEYGSCNKWACKENGDALPVNVDGYFSDCINFANDLLSNLHVVKYCEKNAEANGCIPSDYYGIDKVKDDQKTDPDKVMDPNIEFSTTNIKNKYPVMVLSDGTIIIRFPSRPLYVVDINGAKKPNKWGYDIFSFIIRGNQSNGITKVDKHNYVTEQGGTSGYEMFENMNK